MKNIYDVNNEFERQVAEYCGAPYAVSLDNCSNALFLALMREGVKDKDVEIPSHTYPSVPCEIIHAGGRVVFRPTDKELTGYYYLGGTKVIDSALCFTADMYIPGTFMCLSFTGPFKPMKLGKGGMILTDNYMAYRWFRRARFSGRNECDYHDDYFDMLGWNFYMMPEVATKGLLQMRGFYDLDGNKRHIPSVTMRYPDLSKFKIYLP